MGLSHLHGSRVSRTGQGSLPRQAGRRAGEVSAPGIAWVLPASTADPRPQVQSEAWLPLLYLRCGAGPQDPSQGPFLGEESFGVQ